MFSCIIKVFVTSWNDVIQSHCQYCSYSIHKLLHDNSCAERRMHKYNMKSRMGFVGNTTLPYYVIAQQQAVVILYDTDIWITAVIRFLGVV